MFNRKGSGRSASEIVADFDKNSLGYRAWCVENCYAPSSDDSVIAYLAAQAGASVSGGSSRRKPTHG